MNLSPLFISDPELMLLSSLPILFLFLIPFLAKFHIYFGSESCRGEAILKGFSMQLSKISISLQVFPLFSVIFFIFYFFISIITPAPINAGAEMN